MVELLSFISPGQNIVDVCNHGDKLIVETCSKKCKKVKSKGIAFPTCISVNNCAGHFSPIPEDPAVVLKEGDLVKIDLGVHIDGYISQCAHSTVIGLPSDSAPLSGRLADAVCAAYFAAECAQRLLRPGKTNTEITKIIQKVASIFHVNPLEGVLSHELKRNLIDGNNVIINKADIDQNVEEFKFEVNQVYAIDIVMSTGEGKARETTQRTTVFKRAIDRSYQLKLQAARTIFHEIMEKAPILPFTMRCLDEKKRRMGIVEIVKHDLLDSYPVLFEKDGEFIVQFKFTALVLPTSTTKLNTFPLPHVTSEYSVDSDPEVTAVLAMSTKRKNKKKKPANKGGGGGTGGGGGGGGTGTEAAEGDMEED
eukprot:TRINITY_DN2554_c3_g1_i1.p1 TRINITY_DN2554_c3_g1~~TRINITY_DN2554_c3_g1_i1.p1  ORF type:complete len:409 (-),score=82.20 TRINITY_DN2554_c3_g1_i1:123-1220(-)